jgi:hypothetical protein
MKDAGASNISQKKFINENIVPLTDGLLQPIAVDDRESKIPEIITKLHASRIKMVKGGASEDEATEAFGLALRAMSQEFPESEALEAEVTELKGREKERRVVSQTKELEEFKSGLRIAEEAAKITATADAAKGVPSKAKPVIKEFFNEKGEGLFVNVIDENQVKAAGVLGFNPPKEKVEKTKAFKPLTYQALTSTGTIVTREIDANDPDAKEQADRLSQMGFTQVADPANPLNRSVLQTVKPFAPPETTKPVQKAPQAEAQRDFLGAGDQGVSLRDERFQPSSADVAADRGRVDGLKEGPIETPTEPVSITRKQFVARAIKTNAKAIKEGEFNATDIGLYYDALTNPGAPTIAQFAARFKLDDRFATTAINKWKNQFNEGKVPLKRDNKLARRIFRDLRSLGR